MITLWIYLKIKPRGFTHKLVWDVKKREESRMAYSLRPEHLKNDSSAKNILRAGAIEGILLVVETLAPWRTYHIN